MQRFLLIEDNEIDALSFSRMLQRNNIPASLTHATTAKEAIKHLKSGEYDLIISDYKLPEGSIEQLEPFFKTTPFIITTGLADETVREYCIRHNALAYFVKDIAGDYLLTLPVLLHNFAGHSK